MAVVEIPIRNIDYSFSGREKSVDMLKITAPKRSFFEYGPIVGKPESSEVYWVPVDWMAWKLLVDVLGIPPEMVK